ncbi:hypothetical protein FC40_GL000258 [Ligilactobacillus hayakitensis DSM 18933 = JCM 14209]|uniref:Integral membrane protein n=1 Tax=Ligilactobacillus hayakitensis DSM 18933 = JCM 14209 TaxID=1423755 RepID=A0A0R1WNI6_9LACO|nr:DUF3021 family protein [Ligilactobacillus hayakitensis]KRM19330.1 hypothetical protein FC40_GL000258 [Ligilactobacillus hayakitensis DSM 18933 = JCM 14209]
MKNMLADFCIGVGVAAVIFLMIITLQTPPLVPTLTNTLSVLIVGGLIGCVTLVMDLVQKFWIALIYHFAGTILLVWGLFLFNNWSIDWITLLVFLGIYIIIWAVSYLLLSSDSSRLSHRLNRNAKH